MSFAVDLHLHSNCSDGAYSPRELVSNAKAVGLKVIALTDHDSVEGVAEAVAAGKEYGVEVIPGVELSLTYEEYSGIHLLGYYLDWRTPKLNEALTELRRVRARRGEMIVEKINRLLKKEDKAPLDIGELRAKAKGSVGRPHISQLLIEKGYAEYQQEAFDRYLVPCNVPKKKLSPIEGVALIEAARGIAVLAHPTILTDERRPESAADQLKLIHYMLAQGVEGLEAVYSGYDQSQIDFYRDMARKHNLLITAGSDFHRADGKIELGRLGMGISIPTDIVQRLKERYREKYGNYPDLKTTAYI